MKKLFLGSLVGLVAIFGIFAGQAFAFDLNPSVSIGVGPSGAYTGRAGVTPFKAFDVDIGVQFAHTDTSELPGIETKQDISLTASVGFLEKWKVNASAGYGHTADSNDDYVPFSVGVERSVTKHLSLGIEARTEEGLRRGDDDSLWVLAKYSL